MIKCHAAVENGENKALESLPLPQTSMTQYNENEHGNLHIYKRHVEVECSAEMKYRTS
jgi:hypothetical protein